MTTVRHKGIAGVTGVEGQSLQVINTEGLKKNGCHTLQTISFALHCILLSHKIKIKYRGHI